jgi:hypothetical protein
MSRNALLSLFVFILFAAGASWFYVCKIKDKCGDEVVDVEPTIKSSINQAIAFTWSDHNAMNGNTFDAVKEQLLREVRNGNQLQIIGLYDVEEENKSDYENLGLARAYSIRSLFPELGNQQLSLASEQAELDSTDNYFQASRLNVIFGHTHIDSSAVIDSISNDY